MSDEAKGRVFTEDEHTAILADRVANETAALTAQVSELQGKLDAAESRAVAAEQAAAEAKAAHEAFQAEIEADKERAARLDERLAKVKEAASHLTEEFWNDERVARIVAMDDTAFDGYVADMAESAKVATATPPPAAPPRESAGLHGDPVTPPESKPSGAAREFIMRGFISDQPKEG